MGSRLPPAVRKVLERCAARREELERTLLDPALAKDPVRARALYRELGRLNRAAELAREIDDVEERLIEAERLAAEKDPELRVLAAAEREELASRLPRLIEALEDLLLDDDEALTRDVVLELRAGTGGEEAALFARDLARMYGRYCERRGWRMRPLSIAASDLGGFKEAVFEILGEDAFRWLRFESGVHRVQRVPVTESQGRLHTSAATVAVLPKAEGVDVEIDERDLEIKTTTAQGPGGQHVNKTQSAVRILHRPTGLVVSCQDERSQHKNKAKALSVLRAKLYDLERRRREGERAEARRAQVGSGDRSQRIRTYNFPQNRVTEHRLGRNFSLDKVLDGDLGPLHEELARADRERRLAEGALGDA